MSDDDHGCVHVWVSNSGRGGVPTFRINRMLSVRPVVHVKCAHCDTRTWLTDEQWNEATHKVTP